MHLQSFSHTWNTRQSAKGLQNNSISKIGFKLWFTQDSMSDFVRHSHKRSLNLLQSHFSKHVDTSVFNMEIKCTIKSLSPGKIKILYKTRHCSHFWSVFFFFLVHPEWRLLGIGCTCGPPLQPPPLLHYHVTVWIKTEGHPQRSQWNLICSSTAFLLKYGNYFVRLDGKRSKKSHNSLLIYFLYIWITDTLYCQKYWGISPVHAQEVWRHPLLNT